MAITQSLATSFKVELYQAIHDLTAAGDTIKLALFDVDATLGPTTTAYSTTNEVVGAGYSAGGVTLTQVEPTSSGTTAWVDFANVTFSTVTVSARGGLIYNSSKSDRAIAILDFGYTITRAAADLVVTFPAGDAENAIVRTL